MGTYTIAPRHLRFALSLHARWCWRCSSVSISARNTALGSTDGSDRRRRAGFAAGGEPYSGAIRYRGMLRIAGTFIGCIAALIIIILMIRAPLLMMLVCCLWAGLYLDFVAG